MRILLVTDDKPIEGELTEHLEQNGHEVVRLQASEDDLLAAVERGPRYHAAVLNQAVLGKRWPRQVRHLRRRAPYLPAIVLLAFGMEHAWQHAILAGAFEALPVRSPLDEILNAISRAVEYSAGKPLPGSARPRVGVGATSLPPNASRS